MIFGSVNSDWILRDVYKISTAPQNLSAKLYDSVKAFLETHVDQLYLAMQEKQADLLSEYVTRWSAYHTGTQYINKVFAYLVSCAKFRVVSELRMVSDEAVALILVYCLIMCCELTWH